MKAEIRNLLDQFPFDKVNRVMAVLGWTWYDQPGTPSIPALRREAEKLFDELVALDGNYVCTGGLKASQYRDEDGRTVYNLEFVAVELATDALI